MLRGISKSRGMSRAERTLQRVPFAYHFGRDLVRTYRGIVGPRRLMRAARTQPIRIAIGASGVCDRGWTPTEVEYLDISRECDWRRFFEEGTISSMLAEHVWEHLTSADAQQSALLCYKYLKPGGYLRVAVPDGFHPDPLYHQHVKPGGTGPGADDHKMLYTYLTFPTVFVQAGFSVTLLEYFDENGRFHVEHWNPAGGMIHRSSRFDSRNTNGILNYTSLMLDACKT